MSKPKKIQLKDVTADNWEAVIALKLTEEQEDLVADNTYSLAESKFSPHAVPKAIYAGRKPVGFIMYEPLVDENKPHDYLIYRFMIDRRHQNKGYGRKALAKAIKAIKKDKHWRRIIISYMPDNLTAKSFYASLGFVETRTDEDGEMMAVIARSHTD